MTEILKEIEGVVCYFDDILIHTADGESHRQLLKRVKDKLQEAGLKLNEQKHISRKKSSSLGHIILPDGVKPDQEKVEAIKNMPEPTSVPELRRFLGMSSIWEDT
ncbi:Pol polyprotein [Elysia marginata]|uniref:Pol polyprotein n=1 Tax=Elysia marginata TaxID=1093978 RepID=A0AAV4FT47_9GAST|nr:Pol polyprotein [Elysia marginata]